MARQKGIFKVKGTMDDITFYKSKDGFMVRQKGGVDGKRIATDPVFQRTRENGAEFGRAGKAGKTLRNALRALLIKSKDKGMVGRLTKMMVKVIQADMVNDRGLRNVIDGEAELLKDFEFNSNAQLSTTLYAPFTTSIDRVSGKLTVNVPGFIPLNMVAAPGGATHYQIVSAGAEVDFEANGFVVDTSATAILPLNNVLTTAVTLENEVTPASTKPLFLALGIEFYQEVNSKMYPLKNGSFNPVAITNVSGL